MISTETFWTRVGVYNETTWPQVVRSDRADQELESSALCRAGAAGSRRPTGERGEARSGW